MDGASLVGGHLILSGYARPGATIELFDADATPYTVDYPNDGALATWTCMPVSGGGSAPAGFDRTVTGVRFTFNGTLG